MFKEAGDLTGAERHYLAAAALTPEDADLALQLGHFYKVAGRPADAEQAYREALRLRPDWAEPAANLAGLRRWGWRSAAPDPDAAPDAARGVRSRSWRRFRRSATARPSGCAPTRSAG